MAVNSYIVSEQQVETTNNTDFFADSEVFFIFAVGIVTGNSERVDNPLKSQLDTSPSKSRSLGGFYFFIVILAPGKVIQYWTYSRVVFCRPTTSWIFLYLIIVILENPF